MSATSRSAWTSLGRLYALSCSMSSCCRPRACRYDRLANGSEPTLLPDRRRRPPEANRVVAYDPSWPAQFEAIRRRLAPALEGTTATVEHVGSTSVPGLAAKPIIDIMIVVSDQGQVPDAIDRLAAIGYVHRGDLGVPGREAFSEASDRSSLAYHHLYLAVEGTEPHFNHVGFREHLRRHPEAATRYEARKLEVAYLITPSSRESYVNAKAEVVEQLLTEARSEHRSPREPPSEGGP